MASREWVTMLILRRATLADATNPSVASELPGDRRAVSANASDTQPAKLLAVFVVDTNETELTIPLGK